jgi:hypothetical protein
MSHQGDAFIVSRQFNRIIDEIGDGHSMNISDCAFRVHMRTRIPHPFCLAVINNILDTSPNFKMIQRVSGKEW